MDRTDSLGPATDGVTRAERTERVRRALAGLALAGTGFVAPLVAAALAGEGPTVGAIVGGIMLVVLAVAVWPQNWSERERHHRALDAVWREVRPAAAEERTPWPRFAAWAVPVGERVELMVVRCAGEDDPVVRRLPSPYSREPVRLLEPEDIEAAAEAMEELREQVAAREQRARERWEAARHAAEQRAHEEALQRIDAAAAAQVAADEERMRGEREAEEARERRAQADAVARALRKP